MDVFCWMCLCCVYMDGHVYVVGCGGVYVVGCGYVVFMLLDVFMDVLALYIF